MGVGGGHFKCTAHFDDRGEPFQGQTGAEGVLGTFICRPLQTKDPKGLQRLLVNRLEFGNKNRAKTGLGGGSICGSRVTKKVQRNGEGGVRKRSAGGLWVNLSFRCCSKCFVNIITSNNSLLCVDLPARTYRFNATPGSRRVQGNPKKKKKKPKRDDDSI